MKKKILFAGIGIASVFFGAYLAGAHFNNFQTEEIVDGRADSISTPEQLFRPYALPETDPQNFGKIEFESQTAGSLEPIFFGMPEHYTSLGMTTFRGNNFRNQSSWGAVDTAYFVHSTSITEERLEIVYRLNTGFMNRFGVVSCSVAGCKVENCKTVHRGVSGQWTGVGWSGQPAIVKWDFEIQQIMNIFPAHRDRPDLVEVIQGAMDGYIHFFDLKTGEPTRNRIFVGNTIKGGVSIDPRGYPILYVGHGDSYNNNRFGFLIFSLIDGSEMLFINGRDPFARRSWGAFDGNPVFDRENDRMILPGENGVIYSILLNTRFDKEAATIAIDPVISRYRHTGTKRLGTENSLTAFSHFAFFADNSGLIQCLDLKTLEPVWFFDAGDDTDASLVLEWEEENQMLVIYTGIEVDLQGPPSGIAVIRKLNAANGSLLWKYSIPALYHEPNGGVMATPVLGKNDLSNLVIFKVCKVIGRGGGGILIAFDKQTGDIVWEKVFPHYGWSSPVAVYTPEGAGYILVADSEGNIYMLRGTTGEIVYTISTGELIEATPAVFGNMMVIGTREQHIYGIRIF